MSKTIHRVIVWKRENIHANSILGIIQIPTDKHVGTYFFYKKTDAKAFIAGINTPVITTLDSLPEAKLLKFNPNAIIK